MCHEYRDRLGVLLDILDHDDNMKGDPEPEDSERWARLIFADHQDLTFTFNVKVSRCGP